MNKIPHCGVAVISNLRCAMFVLLKLRCSVNEIIYGVATPAVSTKFTRGPCAMAGIYGFVICLLCGKLSR